MALYTCKKCGKKVPMQYEVCPYCQTPRPAITEANEPLADINKMKICKTCGKLIAKKAKICPKCGAKQKKKHPILGFFLIILGIAIVASVINGGKDKGPQKVGSTSKDQTNPDKSNTEIKKEQKTVFGVGENVSLNDVVVTLVGVSESEGKQFISPEEGKIFIICEFEIENGSNKDITVSSMLSFEAYVDDYSINQDLSATTSSDKNQLDGSVAAGKKMNGVIGYEVPIDWNSIEIKFTPDFWSQKDITFVYSK